MVVDGKYEIYYTFNCDFNSKNIEVLIHCSEECKKSGIADQVLSNWQGYVNDGLYVN